MLDVDLTSPSGSSVAAQLGQQAAAATVSFSLMRKIVSAEALGMKPLEVGGVC